ncbi:MAG: stage II sporulation protein P [Oscillospiraceae bacterium]|nr:stage II sporulation protein P [Oscillospiraceae bacterium]
MRKSGKLAPLGLAVLLIALLTLRLNAEPAAKLLLRAAPAQFSPGLAPASAPAALPAAEAPVPPDDEVPAQEPLVTLLASDPGHEILPTTISAVQLLKNDTAYALSPEQLLAEGPALRLPAEGPQILIIHTHGSEAYNPVGLDLYEASDVSRTQDPHYSVIRVGDELAQQLEAQGLRVLHDREIYDYPSYTGSYSRSGEAVERYLKQYPGIAVVLDLHRDALGTDEVVYKTMAEEEGTVASQIMILVGSDESGLEHPRWRENLSLALYLQEAVAAAHPTLMRPVSLVPQRYNQQLTAGSLILEVGSSGNTLQEALAAVRLFADAAGPALLALTEPGEM